MVVSTYISFHSSIQKYLLDVEHHGGVGLLLILLIVVEQNLFAAHDHVLKIWESNIRSGHGERWFKRGNKRPRYLLLPSVSLDVSAVRNRQPTLQPGLCKAAQITRVTVCEDTAGGPCSREIQTQLGRKQKSKVILLATEKKQPRV